jgi:hypothetical protein
VSSSQQGLCLSDNALYDFPCGRHMVDQTGSFSRNHSGDVEVSAFASLPVALGLLVIVLLKFCLSPKPPLGMSVSDDPTRMAFWPDVLAGYIEYDAACRVVPVASTTLCFAAGCACASCEA